MQNIDSVRMLLAKHWPELENELKALGCVEEQLGLLLQNDGSEGVFSAILEQMSVEHRKKLNKYAELLIKWNRAYNLIGKSTEKSLRLRHLIDSLQLMPHIHSDTKVLDIGSGAGLPAVPLAIMSGATIYACEPLQKRCLFLNQVKRELELKDELIVWNKKTQEIDKTQWQFDVITARAVADVQDLMAWGLPLLKPNGKFVFLKGETAEKEIASITNSQMTFLIKSSITNPNGKVVIIQPK